MKETFKMNHQNSGASRRNLVLAAGAAAAVAGVGVAMWRFKPDPVTASVSHPVWQRHFETPTGEGLDMRSFQGKPLLLNFWAT